MLYTVREHKMGFFLLGRYGTGKTSLSHALMKECSKDQYRIALINNPRLNPLELIESIKSQLAREKDPAPSANKTEALEALTRVLKKNYGKGLYSIVIVDEAQSIDNLDLLEELRLLLNIQMEDKILFTMLLLGQMALLDNIDKIPQFKQRFSVRYIIHPFNEEEETKKYIEHRISTAGSGKTIFSDAAFKEIHSLSKGVPRAINNICDMALLVSFIRKSDEVDRDMVIQAGKDLEENY